MNGGISRLNDPAAQRYNTYINLIAKLSKRINAADRSLPEKEALAESPPQPETARSRLAKNAEENAARKSRTARGAR
jgi:hypothetical protein